MHRPSPALGELVERAYALFRPYRPQAHLDACTFCCLPPEHDRALKTLSLPAITTELLYAYNTAAKPDRLDPGELKYFLPRLLEAVAHGQEVYHSKELHLVRLGYLDRADWTAKEYELLEKFRDRFFHDRLVGHRWEEDAAPDDFLIMFAKAGLPIDPLLRHWTELTERPAALAFAVFMDELDLTRTIGKRYTNAFVERPLRMEIEHWYEASATRQHFRRAFEQIILADDHGLPDELIAELSWKYDVLE